MGMYVFDRDVLFGLLNDHPDLHDFGRDIIPLAIQRLPVHGYPFDGYWTDIGTIGSFFEANLALCEALPRLNLYDADRPIYTHARQLPPSKLQQCRLDRAIVGEGAVLEGCEIERCVVGVRSIVAHGARLKDSVVLGADFHESPAERQKNARLGRPDVGIGAGTHLERCIIDKNARVGRNVFIRGGDGRPDADGDGWHVRDGIVVVVKDGTIPDGTVI
jgi:glucose-1-phosphate adenylyltransferase